MDAKRGRRHRQEGVGTQVQATAFRPPKKAEEPTETQGPVKSNKALKASWTP